MKKTEKEILRKKTVVALQKEYQKKSKELLKARLQLAQGKLKNVKKIAKIRHEMAIILTFIREKQLKGEK